MNPKLETMNSKEQFVENDDGLIVRAPAKINLSLLIAGKRHDGYHEVETIMAKINFYDELLIQKSQKSAIELDCRGPQWAPTGKDNLIYTAATMLLDRCRLQKGVKITLAKNIPAGSGLGSASSDAAATLMGLNKLLNLGLERRELEKLGADLGSDVSFFLGGPLAFCTGRGEKIRKISKIFHFSALLVLPDVSVSTTKVYNNYNHNNDRYKKLNKQINGLLKENGIDIIAKMCANMLQATTFALYEELAALETRLESLGVGPLALSGSGSAMFCILDSTSEQKTGEYLKKIENKLGVKWRIVNDNLW